MSILTLDEIVAASGKVTQARAEHSMLEAELVSPVINLAQSLTRELVSLGLENRDLPVGDESEPDGQRIYLIQRARWRVGLRRESAPVLCRRISWGSGSSFCGSFLELLWDPRQPSRTEKSLSELPRMGMGKGNYLASSEVMATFAQDAAEILNGVCEREAERASHLREGLSCAEALLSEPVN